MNVSIENIFNIKFNTDSLKEVKEKIKDRTLGINLKKTELKELLNLDNNKIKKEIIALLSGGVVNIKNIFLDKEFDEDIKISFKKSNFEDDYDKLFQVLGDEIIIIDNIKAIYDWGVLENILKGSNYISEAKIKDYKEHGDNLKLLKDIFKKYFNKDDYYEMFEDEKQYIKIKNKKCPTNYVAYIGKSKAVNNKSKCSSEDFYRFLRNKLDTIKDVEDKSLKTVKQGVKVELENLLPKLSTVENAVIPYQLHSKELKSVNKL